MAYKANISDTRESPSDKLIQNLIELKSEVDWYDPEVENWIHSNRVLDIKDKYDLIIIAVPHSSLDLLQIRKSSKFILDLTGNFSEFEML